MTIAFASICQSAASVYKSSLGGIRIESPAVSIPFHFLSSPVYSIGRLLFESMRQVGRPAKQLLLQVDPIRYYYDKADHK